MAFDRLARSVTHLISVLDELRRLNIAFISYRENIRWAPDNSREKDRFAEELAITASLLLFLADARNSYTNTVKMAVIVDAG